MKFFQILALICLVPEGDEVPEGDSGSIFVRWELFEASEDLHLKFDDIGFIHIDDFQLLNTMIEKFLLLFF